MAEGTMESTRDQRMLGTEEQLIDGYKVSSFLSTRDRVQGLPWIKSHFQE